MGDDRIPEGPESAGQESGGPGWRGDDSFGGFGNQTPQRNPQDMAGMPPAQEGQDVQDAADAQDESRAGIREHMKVVGSDGEHVGTVDKFAGDRIILTRSDPAAGGVHHWIPSAWTAGVAGDEVRLDRAAAQARAEWHDTDGESGDGAMFRTPGEHEGEGPHILDRSFSGTY